jgi:hypothetical protein
MDLLVHMVRNDGLGGSESAILELVVIHQDAVCRL